MPQNLLVRPQRNAADAGDHGQAPGDMAAEVAVRVAVQRALGSLRAVLVLRVFDDLSEAQVAQVMPFDETCPRPA